MMKTHMATLRLFGTAILLGSLLVQNVSAEDTKGAAQMQQSTMSGMDRMKQMKTSGDVDRDFATMMKMHHQQALDMAKVELEQGKSPELKRMARQIIDSQQKEIREFDTWLKQQK